MTKIRRHYGHLYPSHAKNLNERTLRFAELSLFALLTPFSTGTGWSKTIDINPDQCLPSTDLVPGLIGDLIEPIREMVVQAVQQIITDLLLKIQQFVRSSGWIESSLPRLRSRARRSEIGNNGL